MENDLFTYIGNTPLITINKSILSSRANVEVFAKLEFYNPTGSVKDRAAIYLINKLLAENKIAKTTTLIESSSGNFGIALSAYAKKVGLPFVCVIDPNISPINETLIRMNNAVVIKVEERDMTGGYLLNRIKKVKELLLENKDSYWVNQYENPWVAEAYYHTLGNELCTKMSRMNYIFIGVSSGGTITGVSNCVKKRHPYCKVIAVDVKGSVIFGGPPKKRYIPGIGSSMVPKILDNAPIDDIVVVDEYSTATMCRKLLEETSVFAGGSSGSVLQAVDLYCAKNKEVFDTMKNPANIVVIFPDRGDRYGSTIYNDKWYHELAEKTDWHGEEINAMRYDKALQSV